MVAGLGQGGGSHCLLGTASRRHEREEVWMDGLHKRVPHLMPRNWTPRKLGWSIFCCVYFTAISKKFQKYMNRSEDPTWCKGSDPKPSQPVLPATSSLCGPRPLPVCVHPLPPPDLGMAAHTSKVSARHRLRGQRAGADPGRPLSA